MFLEIALFLTIIAIGLIAYLSGRGAGYNNGWIDGYERATAPMPPHEQLAGNVRIVDRPYDWAREGL